MRGCATWVLCSACAARRVCYIAPALAAGVITAWTIQVLGGRQRGQRRAHATEGPCTNRASARRRRRRRPRPRRRSRPRPGAWSSAVTSAAARLGRRHAPAHTPSARILFVFCMNCLSLRNFARRGPGSPSAPRRLVFCVYNRRGHSTTRRGAPSLRPQKKMAFS